MNWLFASRSQSIRTSALATVLSINVQSQFSLGLISFQSKGLSTVFSSTTIQKCQLFGTQRFLWSHSYICTWLLEKLWLWLNGPLSAKWRLCFLICCSRFVIAFLLRRKSLLISWLQSLSTVILEPKKIKSVTASTFPPSICHESDVTRWHDLSFFHVEFQDSFFTLWKGDYPGWVLPNQVSP